MGLLLSWAMPLSAGPGGGHSHGHAGPAIKAEKAKTVASGQVETLIKNKKIESSWKNIKPSEPSKKSFKNGPEWVVAFTNPKATDKKKAKLFVFVSLDGRVLGANFTGK